MTGLWWIMQKKLKATVKSQPPFMTLNVSELNTRSKRNPLMLASIYFRDLPA